jgi:serine/threonine protein kinase
MQGLPNKIGSYRPTVLIGRGGFGEICRGVSDTGEEVVLKTVKALKPAEQVHSEKSFYLELKALDLVQKAEVRRDVIRMIDCFPEERVLVLEYLPDGDLSAWRHENWALEAVEESMRYFMTQLLHAYLFLHSVGIMHRDIKPHNILLRRSDLWSEKRSSSTLLAFDPVVADFGTAAIPGVADTEFTNHSFATFAGTWVYMAPEMQELHRAPGAPYSLLSDVWSLGVTLLSIYLGVRGHQSNGGPKHLLNQHRSTMSPEFAHLLDGMLMEEPQRRLGWDQLAAHPWFRYPRSHAVDWLEAFEALPLCETLIRPSRVDPLSNQCSDASLTSPQGKVLLNLLEAKDLANYHLKQLNRLHSEWTTDKPRFHEKYVRPWEEKMLFLNTTLPAYDSMRLLATLRAIYNMAEIDYSDSKTAFVFAVEIGRVALRTISSFQHSSSPKDPHYVRPALHSAWFQLLEDTQGLLKSVPSLIDTSHPEPPNSPAFAINEPDCARIPFYVLMHTACVLKCQQYISTLSHFIPSNRASSFIPIKAPDCTLSELIFKFKELKLIMEYVLSILPSPSSSSSSHLLQNSFFSSSTTSQVATTNEQICQDFVERLSRFIRLIPTEMETLMKP